MGLKEAVFLGEVYSYKLFIHNLFGLIDQLAINQYEYYIAANLYSKSTYI